MGHFFCTQQEKLAVLANAITAAVAWAQISQPSLPASLIYSQSYSSLLSVFFKFICFLTILTLPLDTSSSSLVSNSA